MHRQIARELISYRRLRAQEWIIGRPELHVRIDRTIGPYRTRLDHHRSQLDKAILDLIDKLLARLKNILPSLRETRYRRAY